MLYLLLLMTIFGVSSYELFINGHTIWGTLFFFFAMMQVLFMMIIAGDRGEK